MQARCTAAILTIDTSSSSTSLSSPTHSPSHASNDSVIQFITQIVPPVMELARAGLILCAENEELKARISLLESQSCSG